jgi:hypothetical protein
MRRATDPEHRDRLKQYLIAYRRLTSEAQEKLRQIDQDIQEEDAVTRGRFFGVMERYALWLSRVSEADRQRVQTATAGPERLRVVRELLDKQWLDGLPPARKEKLAKATADDQAKMVEKWRREGRERQQERIFALRAAEEMMIPGQPERFRLELQRFVKTELEPKLSVREKTRLQSAMNKGPLSRYASHQIWSLSEAHGLKPPGPIDFWSQFREQRKVVKPPE